MSFNVVQKYFFYLILSFLVTKIVVAQDLNNNVELNTVLGSSVNLNTAGLDNDLPFWLHANRDGVIDQGSANSISYLAGSGKYFLNKDWRIEVGGKAVLRFSDNSSAFLNEIFMKFQGYDFILAAGKYIDPLAQKEDDLSTGSFMISRNASPIPKIALYTDGFVGVPKTNGIINYSGMFAHGWFEDDRYVKNAYLHQKYLYLKIQYAFFEAVGGIVHNTQWAGISPTYGELPSGWETFKEVVFASGSSESNAPGGEQNNAIGNSVAAYDFSLKLLFEKVDLKAYRLFYLEDKVSTQFRSPWDGVWGIKIEPKGFRLIDNILWEHVNTKRQDSFDFEPAGTSRYYNNFIYRTGWTYHRRVIGNPLLLTNASDGSGGGNNYPIYNNIIIGHHIGFSGKLLSNLRYNLKYTYTRNYGNFTDQIIRRLDPSECDSKPTTTCAELRPLSDVKQINHSAILELIATPANNERFKYGLSLATDFGELYTNRMGIMFKLEYNLF